MRTMSQVWGWFCWLGATPTVLNRRRRVLAPLSSLGASFLTLETQPQGTAQNEKSEKWK
jgi:hypothetical protein